MGGRRFFRPKSRSSLVIEWPSAYDLKISSTLAVNHFLGADRSSMYSHFVDSARRNAALWLALIFHEYCRLRLSLRPTVRFLQSW